MWSDLCRPSSAKSSRRARRARRQGLRRVDTAGLIARDDRLLADLAEIDAVRREKSNALRHHRRPDLGGSPSGW